MPLNLRQRQLAALDLERRVWAIYTDRGISTREIAAELGASQSAVVRALKRAERRSIVDIDTARRTALAQLERGRQAAWQAYQASIADRVKRRSRRRSGGSAYDETEIVTEPSPAGDPRFLAEHRQCVEAIAKIAGLSAPIRVQAVAPDRPFEDLSDDDLRRELAAAAASLPAAV
jgi:DNA-binding MarR family transcriptional regulator